MRKISFFVIISAVLLFFIDSGPTRAQSPDSDGFRFEVGGQFSLLHMSTVRDSSGPPIICITSPCPNPAAFERSREAEPGFGGRLGYNITNYLAVEGEVNFFPREQRLDGGRDIEGLFGIKAGRRFEKIGLFAKLRPGFLSSRRSVFRPISDIGCIAIVPPPAGCFEETRKRETDFAFDIGGVVELYPTDRMIVRFDAGDTIIRLPERRFIVPFAVILTAPAETTHNFQGSVGLGFRF